VKIVGMFRKVSAKVWTLIFRAFGVDWLSRTRIHSRADLAEIGSRYGGWVVPTSLLGPNSICYCVGCGEDISFDLGLIEQIGCDVYALDPTPRAIEFVSKRAGDNPQYHFLPTGLWDKKDTLRFYAPRNPDHVSHSITNLQKTDEFISVEVDRLSNVMRQLGHENIDLLKIDIEGAEYKVLDSIMTDKIPVQIICVEYDETYNPLDDNFRQRIRESVSALGKAGYVLVCAQGNGNYTFVHSGHA